MRKVVHDLSSQEWRPESKEISMPGCTVCLSSCVGPEPFYYIWRDQTWRLHRCNECTHQFVWPLVSGQEQQAIYNDYYFSSIGDWVEGVWPKSYVEAENELRREANEVLRIIPVEHGRLLEIGCAGGFFLDEARKRFDVVGIELNKSMADHAVRLGIDIICGRIEDVEPKGSFDILVMMDVLEHLPNPHVLFSRIANWLTPNACVVIRGPVNNDPIVKVREWIRRVLWIDKRLQGYPLDANKFSLSSLTRLLAGFGFRRLIWHGMTKGFATVVAMRG